MTFLRSPRGRWSGSVLLVVLLGLPAAAQQHIVVEAVICDSGCSPLEIRVWDGDSIRLGMTPEAEAVRIAGIDAPEITDAACPQEALAAAEARDRLAELLATGPVAIERTGRDRYGRTLADLSLVGRDIGEALISEGLALPYGPDRRGVAEAHWCGGSR